MYNTAILLLVATFCNYFHSLIIQEYFPYKGSWYDWVFCIQVGLILMSVLQYKPNRTNKTAVWGYFCILVLNWTFYKWGWFDGSHFIASATGMLYSASVVTILLIDAWKVKR